MIGHWRRVRATIFLVAATFPLLPSPTTAQGSGQGFLFKQPRVQLGVHAGYTLARAGGPVLDFARDELTLNKRDFDASSWGLELAVRGTERLDITFDVRFSRSEVGSEMRDWVDLDNLPIQQTTTFVRVPITVSTKFYLRDPRSGHQPNSYGSPRSGLRSSVSEGDCCGTDSSKREISSIF